MSENYNTSCIDVLLIREGNRRKHISIPNGRLADFQSLATEIKDEIRTFGADRVLMPSGREEDDLCSYLSASFQCSVFTGCLDLPEGKETAWNHVVCTDEEGLRNVVYELPSRLSLITVKNRKVFDHCIEQEPGDGGVNRITEHVVRTVSDAHSRIIVKKMNNRPVSKSMSIEDADCIVAGGRGFDSPEKFRIIQTFAELLGAEYATSRPNVDAGWIEKDRQVGLSGKIVAPQTYIACGISGTAHHTIGMSESEWIMAINIDRNEPIFDIADVGVIGDANAILKRVTEIIRQSREKVLK